MSHPVHHTLPVSLLALLCSLPVMAASANPTQPVEQVKSVVVPPLSWVRNQTFRELGQSGDWLLSGMDTTRQLEFGMRRDRIVREGSLHLRFTPSPALLPTLSHLRVYLNEMLMEVLPIAKDDLGKTVTRKVALDTRLLGDFNRVRVELVGHYTDICEDPTNSTLWVNIGQDSRIVLQEQSLQQAKDMAYFPAPFFDGSEQGKSDITMVFAANPSVGEQQAAALLASYFGVQAKWRGLAFPVLFDQLPAAPENQPSRHTVVWATNTHRPAFLADLKRFPLVDAPIVELLDHPENPQTKILVVWGRNDEDLIKASLALAQGNKLFRGQRVVVNEVQALEPRQPYDAPNWMPTNRVVNLGELVTYPQQLQTTGLQPNPISVDINVPPDLFVWRNRGVPLNLLYRYTAPTLTNSSRLNVSMNGQLIAGLPLENQSLDGNWLRELRLSLLAGDSGALDQKVSIPALKIGDRNQLRFDFAFASILGSSLRDHCETTVLPTVQAAVDESSTIDLSGYHHYMGLPDLRAFARTSFPFSRMADLSETLILIPKEARPMQVGLLLETVASLSAHIGYPAMRLRITDNLQMAQEADADLLVLGQLPEPLRHSEPNPELLMQASRDSLLQPTSGEGQQKLALNTASLLQHEQTQEAAASLVDISAQAPIAAIVGQQSPFYAQRSVVALLANQDEDYQLLRAALGDVGKREAMAGSVVLIRTSGVYSQFVGDHYFVGSLPWWQLLWFHLSTHPLLLALVAVLTIVLMAFLLWQALQRVTTKRLTGRD